MTVTSVDDALLTRVEHGPLRALHQPKRWLRGAVHDSDGRLLVSSQKIGGLSGNQWVASDPSVVKVPRNADGLEGTWLYGGHWMRHFGHFISETVPTLWPRDLHVDGLVFHKYFAATPPVQPWQKRLLELAGLGHLPVRIVRRRPLRAQLLLVPDRAVVANGWAQPQARDVWLRMAGNAEAATPGTHRRIYLTRTSFNAAQTVAGQEVRTTPARDAELDEVFAAHGFAVVAPECLTVDEQIRLVAGADVIAGVSGSALHLSGFAPTTTRLIEVGDIRTPERPVPMQQAIDAACGRATAFVPHGSSVKSLRRTLRRLGLRPRRS